MPLNTQDLMMRFVQRVDPFTKAGVVMAAGGSGTTNGDKFTATRRIDIYNESRGVLFQVLRTRFSLEMLSEKVGRLVAEDASLSFSAGVATLPTDYVAFISLATSADVQVIRLPASLISDVIAELNPHLTESASNAFVFEQGNTLKIYNSTLQGSPILLKLRYWGFGSTVDATTLDAGSESEIFPEEYYHVLLEIMVALANEQGQQEVLALTSSLIEKQGE